MRVNVPQVPVALYFAHVEQLDDAVRWLWVVVGDEDHRLPLTADDAAATEEILQLYRPQRRVMEAQATAARARGDASFTLEVDLPTRAKHDLERLLVLLEGVNKLVKQQGLAAPASPEIAAFRQGLIREIARQLQAAEAAT